MFNVYYSKMNITPHAIQEVEKEVIKSQLPECNVVVNDNSKSYWSGEALENCNVVFVTGYNNMYKGKGVYTEIKHALNHNIPIFLMASIDEHGYISCDIRFDEINPIIGISKNDINDWKRDYCVLEVHDEIRIPTIIDNPQFYKKCISRKALQKAGQIKENSSIYWLNKYDEYLLL